MKGKFVLLVLALAWLNIENVNAMPVTIDASSYAPGTDISHAIDGVYMQQYHHASFANTITYSPATTSVEDYCQNEGGGCLSSTLNLSYQNDALAIYLQYPFTGLDVSTEFAGLSLSSNSIISSIGFSATSENGYPMWLFMFDKHNNYIGLYNMFNDTTTQFGCGFANCYHFSSSADISAYSAYTVYVANLDYTLLDSLTVNVPEPPAAALLVVGLIGLGAIRRRNNV